jgi:predicted enzyme related to lactoylglutathione lyase
MTASLGMIGIDCADPSAVAEFYHQLIGWPIVAMDNGYAMIQRGDITIVFWRIEGYRPPTWPQADTPKQFHFDLMVDDLDIAVAHALELGATLPSHQAGAHWRVLFDPAGHPFCLTNPQ